MSAATTTQKVVSADGTTIAYEKAGTGPALVLVDGALCDREFGPSRSITAELADRYTVYCYDRRGRGESGNTEPYSVQKEVDDLAAVIGAAGGDAFVAGQSSGAALALETAASGVKMRKLAAYEAPYVGQKPGLDYTAELQRRLAAGDKGGAVGFFMTTMVGAPFFVPVMLRMMGKVWKALKAMASTLPNDSRVMDGFSVPKSRFAKIAVPTLVMGGTKGSPAMKAAVTSVAAAVPGSELRMLVRQTHQVSPQALATALKEYFAG